MKSYNEIEEFKKEIIIDALNYSLNTRLIETIDNFDYTNKKHIIFALKNYRNNIKLEEEEKTFLNQMLVNTNNIPDIKYERLIPKLIETQQTKEVKEKIEKIKEPIRLSNEAFVSIKDKIKKDKEIKNKDEKIKESLHFLMNDKIEKNLEFLTLEELIKEAHNRLVITKSYIKKVEKSLIENE